MSSAPPNGISRCCLTLPCPATTDALGVALGDHLLPGDTVMLSGPIGAGKSHLARAVIRRILMINGAPPEDIPSPTYTLVQSYVAGQTEIWHADLYRLSDPMEVIELGLFDAFESAICLIEWPDRLGADTPRGALNIRLDIADRGRVAILTGPAQCWQSAIETVTQAVRACS